jgi:glycine cleavage system aminomethyltransferase T
MTEDDGSVSGDHVVMRRGDERYFCNHVIRLDEKDVSGQMVNK